MKSKKIITGLALLVSFTISYARDFYKPSDISVYTQGSNVADSGYSDIQESGYGVLWGMFFGDNSIASNPTLVSDLYIWLGDGNLLAQPSYVNSATANGKI